jgi:hypothetical protein
MMKRLRYIARLVVGGLGTFLLALLALSHYVTSAINDKYFGDASVDIGWADILCFAVALYFLLVSIVGRWRLLQR